MIYFEAEGGLCNRMRALASAYYFSLDSGQKLTVIWRCNSQCNCRFERLFTLNVQGQIKFIQFRVSARCTWINKRHERRIDKIKALCDIVYQDNPYFLDKQQMLKEVVGRNVFIHSYSYWYGAERPFSIFMLRKYLQSRVECIKRQCGKYVCGVHVRRTDHIVCIENSPTSAFIERMQAELEKNPFVTFYVASDDAGEKEHFRKIFGEKVVTNKGAVLRRNTAAGIADAVIDLYVLADTEKILGSVGSSFSEVAAQIKGIPLICCGKE